MANENNLVTYDVFEDQTREWFNQNLKRMVGLLGSKELAKKLVLTALDLVSKNPAMITCTFDSFIRCVLSSAELNLFPGPMQECHYVPFNNKNINKKELQFQISYFGHCQLLYRSGMIKDIEADVICARDHFEYVRGSNRKLVFEPADGDYEDRGEWTGVYCLIRNIFGGEHISYLTARQVLAIKERSQGAKSSFSPWNSQYIGDVAWMWMKTALKQNKFVPKSSKQLSNVILDTAIDTDVVDVASFAEVAVKPSGKPASIEHKEFNAMNIPTSNVKEAIPQAEKSQQLGAKGNAA